MKVFVLGGTGAIGLPAVRSLLGAGHQVTGLARSVGAASVLAAEGAAVCRASIFDADALAEGFAGHGAVVNLATSQPTTARFVSRRAWAATTRIRTDGSAAVVDAAVRAGVATLVQESVCMIYQPDEARWIDEDHAVDTYPFARGNLAAEASARRFTAAGATGIILRFGLFYGPGARHSEQFLALARRHVCVQIGRPDSYTSSIHVDDGGAAVAAVLTAPAGTYNVVDDEPLTTRAYADALAGAAGVRRHIRGPGRLALLLGDRTTSLTRSLRVDNRRLRAATGWRPHHPSARDGYQAMARR